MDQLRKLSGSLSLRQKLVLGAVSILVLSGLSMFVKWNKDRDFRPLYSELSPEDAGAIVAKLRETGTEYRLRESDSTILVPSGNVAELRLQMASAGIPKSGRIGYELFDRTNLGTTDFAEQVNYHRAVEGELERSVMAMAEVDQARVHVTFPKESVFADERQPAKASVMVKLKTGAKLSEQNAAAISQLVSSAIEDLSPDSVSVMDMRGNLLMRPKKPGDGSEPSDAVLQYKLKLERETLAKIDSVLDPLLGSSKYRAAVDIDCDLTSGEQSEEAFDPTHSVITSSQKSEEGSTGKDTAAGGVPGTSSNLPRPAVRPATQAGHGLAKRSENIAYETSRTVKKVRLPQGMIRRMSVSVLVDQDVRWQMTGKGAAAHAQRIIDPPSADRLKTVQAVVAAAAGVNTNRGDLLSVETQPFEATLMAEPPGSVTPPKSQGGSGAARKFSPVMIGSAAGVLLLLGGLGFVFYRKNKATQARIAEMQKQLAAAEEPQKSRVGERELTGGQKSVDGATQQSSLESATEMFQLKPIGVTKVEVLAKQVHDQVAKDPAALARIVRSWLKEGSQS